MKVKDLISEYYPESVLLKEKPVDVFCDIYYKNGKFYCGELSVSNFTIAELLSCNVKLDTMKTLTRREIVDFIIDNAEFND